MLYDTILDDSPSCHVHILQVCIVGSGLQDQDFGIGVFSETPGDHTTGRSATVSISLDILK